MTESINIFHCCQGYSTQAELYRTLVLSGWCCLCTPCKQWGSDVCVFMLLFVVFVVVVFGVFFLGGGIYRNHPVCLSDPYFFYVQLLNNWTDTDENTLLQCMRP